MKTKIMKLKIILLHTEKLRFVSKIKFVLMYYFYSVCAFALTGKFIFSLIIFFETVLKFISHVEGEIDVGSTARKSNSLRLRFHRSSFYCFLAPKENASLL